MIAFVTKPTLYVDTKKVQSNIEKMKTKADKSGSVLQPHFKTHQSLHIASLFKDNGIYKATVSSLSMAKYFADGGWNELHLAMPAIKIQKALLSDLTSSCSLTVNVSCKTHIQAILGSSVAGAYIDIDSGYGRTGVHNTNLSEIELLISELKRHGIKFMGFYNHNGSTYHLENRSAIASSFKDNRERLLHLKSTIDSSANIMLGDTPGCSTAENFDGIDIISAGNFVYYDYMQFQLGSCQLNDIAVFIRCPIIESRHNSKRIIVHGGAVHFSKESMEINGKNSFGQAIYRSKEGDYIPMDGQLISLSQEHGILELSEQQFSELSIGDSIDILPIHSCLTVDAMKTMETTDGNSISILSN